MSNFQRKQVREMRRKLAMKGGHVSREDAKEALEFCRERDLTERKRYEAQISKNAKMIQDIGMRIRNDTITEFLLFNCLYLRIYHGYGKKRLLDYLQTFLQFGGDVAFDAGLDEDKKSGAQNVIDSAAETLKQEIGIDFAKEVDRINQMVSKGNKTRKRAYLSELEKRKKSSKE